MIRGHCDLIKESFLQFSFVKNCNFISDDLVRLETIFLYPNGSSVDVFIKMENDLFRTLSITDLGQTVSYLADVHVFPYDSERKQGIIASICKTLNIECNDGELFVRIDGFLNVAQNIVLLAQACIRVSDLIYTKTFPSKSKFKDFIEGIIKDCGCDYNRDSTVRGQYNNIVKIDFVTNRGISGSDFLMTLSASSQSSGHEASNEVFRKWFDLSNMYKDKNRLTIINMSDPNFRDDDIKRIKDKSDLLFFPNEEFKFRDLISL